MIIFNQSILLSKIIQELFNHLLDFPSLSDWLRRFSMTDDLLEQVYSLACPQSNSDTLSYGPLQVLQNLTAFPQKNSFCDTNIVIDLLNWTKTAVLEYHSLTSHEQFCR